MRTFVKTRLPNRWKMSESLISARLDNKPSEICVTGCLLELMVERMERYLRGVSRWEVFFFFFFAFFFFFLRRIIGEVQINLMNVNKLRNLKKKKKKKKNEMKKKFSNVFHLDKLKILLDVGQGLKYSTCSSTSTFFFLFCSFFFSFSSYLTNFFFPIIFLHPLCLFLFLFSYYLFNFFLPSFFFFNLLSFFLSFFLLLSLLLLFTH